MRKNFWLFYKESLQKFGEAIINLFIFLPYFFSVGTLLKTLFYPWRNLQTKKTTVGFTFSDWGNRFAFNFISRTIGFFMRLSIISFYFIFQTAFMIGLPFIALAFFLLSPISYLLYLFRKSPDEQKKILKDKFISKHLLKEENRKLVEDWFENYYQKRLGKADCWKLSNLFSYPPLARDWAFGYTPILDQYTTDLGSSSYLHHINNIVNREKEIREVEQILSKNAEANVIIVGEEGVGKHTIIDALAKKIYLGKTNVHLMYRRILKLNMEKVKDKKNFFEELLQEATEAGNIILFVDNFEKYLELSGSLEKYAKSDRLQLIGLTTPFFYQKFILPNEKINRLFSKVDVYEVLKKEALDILLEKFFDFENYHKVYLPYETLVEVIEKSEFYMTYIPFPEKAVDLLDTACVYVKQKPTLTGVEKKGFPTARRSVDIHRLSSTGGNEFETGPVTSSNIVLPEDIDTILTSKTHIPTTITSQMKEKLLHLETSLSSQVFEQEEAITKLSASLRRSFLLIGKRKKPLATFLFLGPTGVGKTATAKAVALTFFSSTNSNQFQPISTNSNYLIRFDMSNYQSKYDIPKLIGDINNNEPGLLAAAIREKPYGVLLLDEIEKADKDLLNIFLTIIDEGYFTDGFGRAVDCKNLVIIATSNALPPVIPSEGAEGDRVEGSQKNVIDYLTQNKIFSPEFLNRFDGVITFNQLSPKTLRLIAQKILDDLSKDVLQLHKIKIEVSEQTINSLIEKGYDTRYGARNMERVIRDEIEDKVAKLILEEKLKSGETITL
ncbi:hypothetical protein COY13_00980 [Candidatus Roizmanbacteria bacterium CG_4_10_14_0_2_um_filter_36_35]|uniref:AAA+ ATPase domain-containing protein n=2 Tax=Candidatus Roizmaniibacteriota TaxID=1752723 RepID=A0A2M7BW50_9BACT|nr:MAG: hypothetical protein COS50_03405 [Candidatus Roizmanbacteria bacterium CG03_land_8_20_14_0_80_35_26]PIZ68551.1 MAG: hypothetical protein COY13_00980 [Candidatus Roizmanbacteria bacterium CG_4_10_14_0_2_um_filter_36_35]